METAHAQLLTGILSNKTSQKEQKWQATQHCYFQMWLRPDREETSYVSTLVSTPEMVTPASATNDLSLLSCFGLGSSQNLQKVESAFEEVQNVFLHILIAT